MLDRNQINRGPSHLDAEMRWSTIYNQRKTVSQNVYRLSVAATICHVEGGISRVFMQKFFMPDAFIFQSENDIRIWLSPWTMFHGFGCGFVPNSHFKDLQTLQNIHIS